MLPRLPLPTNSRGSLAESESEYYSARGTALDGYEDDFTTRFTRGSFFRKGSSVLSFLPDRRSPPPKPVMVDAAVQAAPEPSEATADPAYEHDDEEDTYQIIVPDGVAPGARLTATAPGGIKVVLLVPEGAQPGSELSFSLPTKKHAAATKIQASLRGGAARKKLRPAAAAAAPPVPPERVSTEPANMRFDWRSSVRAVQVDAPSSAGPAAEEAMLNVAPPAGVGGADGELALLSRSSSMQWLQLAASDEPVASMPVVPPQEQVINTPDLLAVQFNWRASVKDLQDSDSAAAATPSSSGAAHSLGLAGAQQQRRGWGQQLQDRFASVLRVQLPQAHSEEASLESASEHPFLKDLGCATACALM